MNHDDLNNVALKEQEANMKYEHTINVCVAASCLSSHADQVKTALEDTEIFSREIIAYLESRSTNAPTDSKPGPQSRPHVGPMLRRTASVS